jgi:Fe-S-cluster-containing dehydrogenase component
MVLVDFHRCVGCGSCEMACSLVHEGVCSATLSRIHVMRRVGAGWNVPLTCAMCERPLCMAACPVGAVEKDPRSGVVTIADERCIGCRQCVQACPFGHADFNPQAGVAFK